MKFTAAFLALALALSSCSDAEHLREQRTSIYEAFVLDAALADSLSERLAAPMLSVKDSLRVIDTQKALLDSLYGWTMKSYERISYTSMHCDKDNEQMAQLIRIAEEMHQVASSIHLSRSNLQQEIARLREREQKASDAYDSIYPASRINKEEIDYMFRLTNDMPDMK